MSDARWFRHIRIEPHLVPAPGARVSSTVEASLSLSAESLGERTTLVVQINFIVDIYPDHRVTRNVEVVYCDEALFELYCETTSDEDIEAAFLP